VSFGSFACTRILEAVVILEHASDTAGADIVTLT